MGLEGLVSKRRDRPHQAGRSKQWVKVKNRAHPAMDRVIGMLLLLRLMYVNARIASNAIPDFVFFRVQEIAL